MTFRLEVGRSDQTELILHLRIPIAVPSGRKHRYLQERRDMKNLLDIKGSHLMVVKHQIKSLAYAYV